MNIAFLSGFFLSLSLIVAIGPQNAFVLRQGLMKKHVFPIVLFCTLSDIILITLGVFGFGVIISGLTWLSKYMFFVGGIWLTMYGILRIKEAYIAESYIENLNSDKTSLKLALTNCAALTWFNPHVYIDTLILIGTVSVKYEDNLFFCAGAGFASLLFFFSLGFGARILSPLMSSRKAWQVLDAIIAIIMFVIAYSMFSESF